MAIKSLQVLNVGVDTQVDKGFMTLGIDKGKIIPATFLCFLIRTDDASILVDTGTHPDDVKMWNSQGSKMILREEDQLPQRLEEAGLSLDDIDLVLMTHLHWDHIGWLSQIHNAEVIIQKDEYNFGLNPPANASVFYFPKRYNSPEIKWKLIEGDHKIMPGLNLLFTPGHTPGHQSVLVELPESGPILLCGDAGFLQENFEKEIIPVFFGDPDQALLSIKKLKKCSCDRNAQLFPTHDTDYWRQHMKKSPEAYT